MNYRIRSRTDDIGTYWWIEEKFMFFWWWQAEPGYHLTETQAKNRLAQLLNGV